MRLTGFSWVDFGQFDMVLAAPKVGEWLVAGVITGLAKEVTRREVTDGPARKVTVLEAIDLLDCC